MPAKRQFVLLGTLEPVSRSYIARALLNARRNNMRIVRKLPPGWFYVYLTARRPHNPIVFAPATIATLASV